MDECITSSPLGPRVTSVIPTDDYNLYLTFSGGEQRIFDAQQLLDLPAFKPLANSTFFKSVKVSHGTIMWPQDIDYCPDTLYIESVPITQ